MSAVELLLLLALVGCVLLGVALVRVGRRSARLQRALDDATEAQRTQGSLLVQRQELDTIKDEFISTVSHELRTPLTSIRGALGLLSAGLLGPANGKAQHLLRIATTNTDRLIRLINEILDLERMQSGRAPLYLRRCCLIELSQQATEGVANLADAAEVRLEVVTTTPLRIAEGLLIDADPDRILQVLTNLLSNAIKFSPRGSIVTLELDNLVGDSVIVRVRDQGRGIPAEFQETIFERFGQVEASDARQKGGTGLGLTICRTIAEQHGGRIWVESPGAGEPGATFVLSLPRQAATALAGTTTEQTESATAGTVLVCDDDEEARKLVGGVLRRQGYRVLEAACGEDLFGLLAQSAASAILLDLSMPGETGWELLRRLKEDPATAAIPVIILSMQAPRRRSGERHSSAIPDGWITKPFQEAALLNELARVLRRADGPARVLLLEDDQDLAAVVIAGFSQAPVQVDHASTCAEALAYCRLGRPDLLILDLALPDGDGFALVESLRLRPELRALPLVVYSGREVSDAERNQLRLGPTEFLTKAKVPPGAVEEVVMHMVETLHPGSAPAHHSPGEGGDIHAPHPDCG